MANDELTTEDALLRMKRGIQWLEENYGLHWREKIDLDAFHIASYECCVVGQLYGEYSIAYDMIDGGRDGIADLGFTLKPEEDGGENLAVLNRVWRDEISQR